MIDSYENSSDTQTIVHEPPPADQLPGRLQAMCNFANGKGENERQHGLKYSLFYGYSGKCLVRYDNERGKGDHRHEGDQEEPYNFVSVEQLIRDFKTDIERLRGNDDE